MAHHTEPHETGASNIPERDLVTAIGLVWGHLGVRQFRPAAVLAQACLGLWPDQHQLLLLGAHALSELGEPLTPAMHAVLQAPAHAPLAALLLRRAPFDADGGRAP